MHATLNCHPPTPGCNPQLTFLHHSTYKSIGTTPPARSQYSVLIRLRLGVRLGVEGTPLQFGPNGTPSLFCLARPCLLIRSVIDALCLGALTHSWLRSAPSVRGHPPPPITSALPVQVPICSINAPEGPGEACMSSYENQRFFPVLGWSTKLLITDRQEWSDANGMGYTPLTSFTLPRHCEWRGEWEVARSEHTDPDGWAYAPHFFGAYSPTDHISCVVRRRLWVRRYRLAGDLAAPPEELPEEPPPPAPGPQTGYFLPQIRESEMHQPCTITHDHTRSHMITAGLHTESLDVEAGATEVAGQAQHGSLGFTEADAGPARPGVEVWERQRYSLVLGWRDKGPPGGQARAAAAPPPDCRWAGPWAVAPEGPADAAGWQYAWDFGYPSHAARRPSDFVRCRRWVRPVHADPGAREPDDGVRSVLLGPAPGAGPTPEGPAPGAGPTPEGPLSTP